MSRIRSLKPSFFTNEDLAELSYAHRLCFAGLWTQADREGRLEDRPRRIKAALFPYDEIDVNGLLTDLAEKGFIVRYGADGVPAIQVTHFLKHQRPKKDEHVSLITAPLLEHSRGIGTAKCIGNREVGDRELGNREVGTAAAGDDCAAFVEAWNELTQPAIPRCRDLTTKRRRHIRTRLTERPLTEWREVMARIQASRFCRGEVPARKDGDQPWVATIDWLSGSPDVAVKVLEGAYDDRKPERTGTAREPSFNQDWYEECGRVHDHDCELDRHRHMSRMLTEKVS